MPRAERRSARSDQSDRSGRSLARAESLARAAHERGGGAGDSARRAFRIAIEATAASANALIPCSTPITGSP